MEVRLVRRDRDDLGEGACWLTEARALLRVDITAGLVHRWSPGTGEQRTDRFDGDVGDQRGVLSERVELPVTTPTCPAFGGDDLATLYVITARHRLARGQQRAEPAAGGVLALEPGVRGLPAGAFEGWVTPAGTPR